MTTSRGISASPGIAMGKVLLLRDDHQAIPQYPIEFSMVDAELARFAGAVERAVCEIQKLKNDSLPTLTNDEVTLLDTHLLMLTDPELSDRVDAGLRGTLLNVEAVISSVMRELISKLSASPDEYLRERASDFHDVSKRILGQLLEKSRKDLSTLEEDVILVCHDLLPSDAIGMDKLRIKGIAMDVGGKTSHTAILARAFEIPAVLGTGQISKLASDGDYMIVDGTAGEIVLKPDSGTVTSYEQKSRRIQKIGIQLMKLGELPAETSDGKLIKLKANIELPDEVEAAIGHGADGIGLYRSEFLFIRPGSLPDEEEQFRAYKYVVEAMNKKPVTIRTLDLGGDKLRNAAEIGIGNGTGVGAGEKNPILGWRAIRYCLAHPRLFKTQLRALYRASVYGNLRIMFPMISGMAELDQVIALARETREELEREGVPMAANVPLGIMIEVPSAALISDLLARKSHFFSIGTNDLIQYTIAVDRGNEHTAYLYDPLHPAVLRLVRTVIENAHREGIFAGMCGEMAGDPLYSLLLLGLGLDEFSMSSFGIPLVKQIIRNSSVAQAEEFVGSLMEITDPGDLSQRVADYMEKRYGLADYSVV